MTDDPLPPDAEVRCRACAIGNHTQCNRSFLVTCTCTQCYTVTENALYAIQTGLIEPDSPPAVPPRVTPFPRPRTWLERMIWGRR